MGCKFVWLMTKIWKYTFAVLLLGVAVVWLNFAQTSSRPKIIGCDVGQGDAFLVVNGGDQILIDGGLPNGKAVDCLSRHLPPFDRTIEVVILTHPDLDHYGGLIEVLKRYDVELLVANSLNSSSPDYKVLKKEVGGRGIKVLSPNEGTDIRIGLMYLDILWPTQQFLAENLQEPQYISDQAHLGTQGESLRAQNDKREVLGTTTSKKDPNNFSVVVLLSLGEYDALFTGDVGPSVSDKIADIMASNQMGTVEYIKVPHHGSKNGMTEKLLQKLQPKVAVISAGKGNRYGHPHKEILQILEKYEVEVHGTYEEGDVVVSW